MSIHERSLIQSKQQSNCRNNMQERNIFSANLPIPTRVPTVNSENSMFHSSKGNKGLFKKGDVCKSLFQFDSMTSVLRKSPLLFNVWPLYSWGDEGNDIAFWVEPVCFRKLLHVSESLPDASSWQRNRLEV